MSKLFKKWNDLNQFHEVRKNLNYPRIWQTIRDNDGVVNFGFKIKLHGTNACVRVEPDGKVVAQKRSSDVDVGHFGFAQWVKDNEKEFAALANVEATRYIYGEWCGPGVQQDVACSMTDEKVFYIFAFDEVMEYNDNTIRYYEPEQIEGLLGKNMPNNLIVVPWHTTAIIDFQNKTQIEKTMLSLNQMVEAIGEEDPLVKELFDISGAGEGLVAYPLLGKTKGQYDSSEEYFSWLNFKAKSESHRVNKTKTAVQFDPEKFLGIQAFADFYATDARMLQSFRESVNEERDMKRTGDFVKWVVQDIYKESSTEREANPELNWNSLSKACSTRAALWYKNKVSEII